jgi:hypothetical protein
MDVSLGFVTVGLGASTVKLDLRQERLTLGASGT